MTLIDVQEWPLPEERRPSVCTCGHDVRGHQKEGKCCNLGCMCPEFIDRATFCKCGHKVAMHPWRPVSACTGIVIVMANHAD